MTLAARLSVLTPFFPPFLRGEGGGEGSLLVSYCKSSFGSYLLTQRGAYLLSYSQDGVLRFN